MIYLDYAASTPINEEVLNTFYDISKNHYANPNSIHKLGKEAKQILDKSTNNIAKLLGINSDEIIYTSGASESNNLVIKGICERYKNYGKHILLSSLEHQSIIAPATRMQEKGFEVELIPINKEGQVDLVALEDMIREDTILVSVCYIDSELGIKQPINEISEIVKQHEHCIFHTDASQIIGKDIFDFSKPDLITIAPHKFYGMNGFGALIKKKGIELKPLIDGGKSTTTYRSGTPNLAQIVALDKSLELIIKNQKKSTEHVEKIYNKIINELKKYELVHINNTNKSNCYVINLSIKNVKSTDFVEYMSNNNIFISAKTSCCPVETPSKLVYALTHDKSLASSSIRISLSYLTTDEEIEEFLKIFEKGYKELTNGKI